MIEEEHNGVGGLLMLLEHVGADAVSHLEVDGLVSFCSFLGGQCTEILGKEWGYGVGIAVAHNEELEVVGISETLTVEFEDAVVVDFVEVFRFGAEGTFVVVIDHLGNGVLQRCGRLQFGILHVCLAALDGRVVCLEVFARSGEVEIGELEHGLEVLLHASARNAFTLDAYICAYVGLFACQLLAEFGGAEVAPSTYANPSDVVGLVILVHAVQ